MMTKVIRTKNRGEKRFVFFAQTETEKKQVHVE